MNIFRYFSSRFLFIVGLSAILFRWRYGQIRKGYTWNQSYFNQSENVMLVCSLVTMDTDDAHHLTCRHKIIMTLACYVTCCSDSNLLYKCILFLWSKTPSHSFGWISYLRMIMTQRQLKLNDKLAVWTFIYMCKICIFYIITFIYIFMQERQDI